MQERPRRRSKDALAAYRIELERSKAATTLEALFRLARTVNDTALSRVRQKTGIAALRASHTALLPHIDLAGTRLTTLAVRLGVSKQAVGQLVDELEGMGFLKRVPDPQDGRAKLVHFTRRGRAGILTGLSLLRELEGEFERELGPERWLSFRRAVLSLLSLAAKHADSHA